jgi:WD40 repeat protein/serine/threonine protein kinase
MDGKSKQPTPIYKEGQRVGQYEVIETLEQTRFKQTYLARQVYRHTQMMIDVLPPPLLDELKEDFQLQAAALMKLKHPYILQLQDANVQNHYPFLVAEHKLYRTLRQVYPQGSIQPLAIVARQLEQLASALHYAHTHQVLHGDIRPENIMLDKNKNVLLWGFLLEAVAQNRERLHYQHAGVANEAIGYAAPEKVQGKVQPASDQYSLAVLVYELLCGILPFTGTALEVAYQQIHAAPPSLRTKVPGVSSAVEEAVMKALAKEPGQRFASVQAFISALMRDQKELHRAEPARPAPAQPTGVIEPPMRPRSATPPAPVKSEDVRKVADAPSPAFQPPVPLAAPTFQPPMPPITPPAFQPPMPPITPPAFQPPMPPKTVPPPQRPNPAMDAPVFQTPALNVPAAAVFSPPPAPVKTPPAQTPPINAPAPRRGDGQKVTRRVFAIGLVGVAALGGAGGWYYLSQRLANPGPPTVGAKSVSPATPITVNHKQALIFAGHLASVNAVAWSPDGRLIASGSDDTFVQIFDAQTGQRQVIYSGHTEEVAAVGWSPNGKSIASGGEDKTVQVWNAASGAKLLSFTGHTDRVNGVSWSSDNQLIASGGEDKSVQVWSASNAAVSFDFLGHTAGVLCVGWQPDNSSVASGSWDGTLRDWATVQHGEHFNAGDQIFSYGGHGKNEVNALAWSPNSAFIVSVGADQTAQISNGDNGTPRPPFFTDHKRTDHINPVLSVAWSPDGSTIASGDNDGNVYVWKTTGRKTFFRYQGHKGPVNAVAWSPDGTRIASASSDGTVHVWQPS